MQVWLCPAGQRGRTLYITRYDPKVQQKNAAAAHALELAREGAKCSLSLVAAATLPWDRMQRLSQAHAPLLGCLGLLNVQNGALSHQICPPDLQIPSS